MSGYDSTLNYNLKKPWVDADFDVWGDHWNQNADAIDNLFQTLSNKAIVGPSPDSGGRGKLWWDSVGGQLYVEYNDGNSVQYVSANSVIGLPVTGGQLTGPLLLYHNATQPLEAVPLQQLTAATAGFLPTTGGVVSGGLTVNGLLTASGGGAFTDLTASGTVTLPATTTGPFLPATGGVVSGGLTVNGLLTASGGGAFTNLTASGTVTLPATTTGPFLPLSGGTVSGGTTFQAAPTVTLNATSAPAVNDVMAWFIGADAASPRVLIDSFSGFSQLSFRHAQGTAALPGVCTTGINLGVLNYYGYDGAAYTSPRASFSVQCEAIWTTLSTPTRMVWSLTASGTITNAEVMRLSSSGNLLIGTTTNGTIKLDVNGAVRTGIVGFNGAVPAAKPSITGSRAGNAALASLLTALAATGLIADTTTA